MVVVGIDCGGTFIKGGVVDKNGDILIEKSIPTGAGDGINPIVERICNLVKELASHQKQKVSAVGVGFAAPVDSSNGIILTSPAFKGWQDVPLAELMKKHLGLSVYLDNDANLVTFGEYCKGAGRNTDILVGITLGTGIGGGIIIGGKIYTGASGIAGEVGHILIDSGGPLCGCGNKGCLEAMASSTAVVRMAREAINKEGDKTKLSKVASLTGASVFETAREGDPASQDIFKKVGWALGMGIVSIAHIISPGKIVIGGGGAGAWDLFIGSLNEVINKRVFRRALDYMEIVPGILGDKAGIIGAAFLALKEQGESV